MPLALALPLHRRTPAPQRAHPWRRLSMAAAGAWRDGQAGADPAAAPGMASCGASRVLARTQEQAIDHTRATGQASVDYIAAVTRMARKSKQLSARFWRASRQTSCQFGGAPSRLSPIFEARLACLCRTRRPSKWASSSRPATTLAYWALGSGSCS